MRKRMINSSCYTCKASIVHEAVPVVLNDMDGGRKTYWGKDDAVRICRTCRQEPAKLKAARLAAGMPAKPTLPEEFDDYEEEQISS